MKLKALFIIGIFLVSSLSVLTIPAAKADSYTDSYLINDAFNDAFNESGWSACRVDWPFEDVVIPNQRSTGYYDIEALDRWNSRWHDYDGSYLATRWDQFIQIDQGQEYSKYNFASKYNSPGLFTLDASSNLYLDFELNMTGLPDFYVDGGLIQYVMPMIGITDVYGNPIVTIGVHSSDGIYYYRYGNGADPWTAINASIAFNLGEWNHVSLLLTNTSWSFSARYSAGWSADMTISHSIAMEDIAWFVFGPKEINFDYPYVYYSPTPGGMAFDDLAVALVPPAQSHWYSGPPHIDLTGYLVYPGGNNVYVGTNVSFAANGSGNYPYTVEVRAWGNDIQSVAIWFEGDYYHTVYDRPFTFTDLSLYTMAAGNYTFEARARDSAGESAVSYMTVQVSYYTYVAPPPTPGNDTNDTRHQHNFLPWEETGQMLMVVLVIIGIIALLIAMVMRYER